MFRSMLKQAANPKIFIGGKLKSPDLREVITEAERTSLKRYKIKYGELRNYTPLALHRKTDIDYKRCEKLVSLSVFQTLHGVSIKASLDLWLLGHRNLTDVSKADPNEMYHQMIVRNPPQDPCVEDTFFAAVGQSIAVVDFNTILPAESAQWWHWMELRGKDRKALLKKVEELVGKINLKKEDSPIVKSKKRNASNELVSKTNEKKRKVSTELKSPEGSVKVEITQKSHELRK